MKITIDDFKKQLKVVDEWPNILKSLWYDFKGDWDTAHSIAQEILTDHGSAVHAYLHRKEGVLWNADYWYNRAGRTRPSVSLEEEWEGLVLEMVGIYLDY